MKVSFFGLMFLLFLGLKLGEVIAWSWIWVCAPLWLPLTIGCIIAIIMVIGVIAFDGKGYAKKG
jgi:hypothetical protein